MMYRALLYVAFAALSLSACNDGDSTPPSMSPDASGQADASGVDCIDGADGDMDGLLDCDEPMYMTDPAVADTDGDGLLDGAEVLEHGTNPVVADSDGDGDSDGQEVGCMSDPSLAAQSCPECGWSWGDPGTLMSTGTERDDVVSDMPFIDQCGEDISLWDFADGYAILFMTTAWCGRCKGEARELPERTRSFVERTGIPFTYIITLAESERRGEPTAADARAYASSVSIDREIPVVADVAQQTLSHTPWEGSLPGKCIIERGTMRIVNCWVGHGDDADALEYIEELHAAASGG